MDGHTPEYQETKYFYQTSYFHPQMGPVEKQSSGPLIPLRWQRFSRLPSLDYDESEGRVNSREKK